jgi:hypothetical protein
MYFDELRPRTTKAAEYWNSAAPPDEAIIAESFAHAVSLLPAKSSSDHELQEKLRKIAVRLRRQLRQDDWGPSRGDQTAALRQILKQTSALKRAIERLSHSECEQFCALFRQRHEAERPASWAELATLIYETAVDGAQRARSQARLRNIAMKAEFFCDYPNRIDDNTRSAIFDSCAGEIPAPSTHQHTYVLADIRVWLDQFAVPHAGTLRDLDAQRGPELFFTLDIAVGALAKLYTAEAGLKVTHSLDLSGFPASKAGKFIVAAILAMRPPARELNTEFIAGLGKHASMWLSEPALKRQVAQALRRVCRKKRRMPSTGT